MFQGCVLAFPSVTHIEGPILFATLPLSFQAAYNMIIRGKWVPLLKYYYLPPNNKIVIKVYYL